MNPVLTNLRTLMVSQDVQARSFRDLRAGPDGHYDPAICSTALGWFMTFPLPNIYTVEEKDVLNLASQFDGYIHRV
jgi:hypothetical protein